MFCKTNRFTRKANCDRLLWRFYMICGCKLGVNLKKVFLVCKIRWVDTFIMLIKRTLSGLFQISCTKIILSRMFFFAFHNKNSLFWNSRCCFRSEGEFVLKANLLCKDHTNLILFVTDILSNHCIHFSICLWFYLTSKKINHLWK